MKYTETASKALTLAMFFLMALALPAINTYAVEKTDAATGKTTMDNLLTAFNGESNAHARYLAFAQKADEEGYGQIASLLRSAAQAEQIHSERHAKVIKRMGGNSPTANITSPEVMATKENLKAALDGETYEKDTMYPEFMAKAQADKMKSALSSFKRAQMAEAVHATLYAEALKNMESMKVKKSYFVCPECGNIMTDPAPGRCQICGAKKARFITVI